MVALTGSGVSAESGVPTFREAQSGLWARYDARELATPEAFARDPRVVWEWRDASEPARRLLFTRTTGEVLPNLLHETYGPAAD